MEYTNEQLKRLHEVELDLYHELARICKKYNLVFVTGFGTTLGAIRHHGFIPWDDDMDFLMPRADYEKLIEVAPSELGERYALLEPRTQKNYVMTFAKLIRKDSTFVEKVDMHVKYHCGIFIDIFPMDYWPQEKKQRDRVAFRCYLLARLCVLSVYARPKLPQGLGKAKRFLAYAGCGCIHCVLRLFGVTPEKIYKKYRKYASLTPASEAEGYVTDMTWCWIRNDGMFGLQYKDTDLFSPYYVKFEEDEVPVPEKYETYLNIAYPNYMELPPVEKRHSHKPEVLIFPREAAAGETGGAFLG